jgi:hypothetical protein
MRSIRKLVLHSAAIWAAAAIAPRAARAGAVATCEEPFAFATADVNVVVLPYFPAARGRALGGLGNELALLVKLETLYRALSFNHWGVTLLTGSRQACDPTRVTSRLIAQRMIKPGGRLIVVFGNLYQRDDDIYVQTFARTYRAPARNERVAPADVTVRVGTSQFAGHVGIQDIPFPPQLLSAEFIKSVADAYTKSAFIYARPSLTASKRPMPLVDELKRCDECHVGLAFGVVGRQGDWVQITLADGERGYLHARQDSASLVGARLPELAFINGLMGYLRYNGQSQDNTTPNGVRVAARSLETYAASEASAQEPETRATAWQLAAILGFTFNKTDPAARLDSAYQLVPFSAEARNLAATFRLYRAYYATGRNVRPTEATTDFLAAAALDPANTTVLRNVQAAYELLAAPATAMKVDTAFAIPAAEVQSQLAKIRAIRGPR